MFDKWAEKLNRRVQDNNSEIQFREYDASAAEPTVVPPVAAEPEPIPTRTAAVSTADTAERDGNIELKVVRPESYSEVSTIADYLLDGCTVVLNLELMDKAATLRMLDFLNGVTYCNDGEIKKVTAATYIITPHNVDVSDDQEED